MLAGRHDELARILSRIYPVHRAQAVRDLHAVAGEACATELRGPVPL